MQSWQAGERKTRQPFLFCYNMVMNKAKIFSYLGLSFMAGIFGASFFYSHIVARFWFSGLLVGTLIIEIVFYRNKIVSLIFFIVLFFLSGAWLTTVQLEKVVNLKKEKQNFVGEVVVVKEPTSKDRLQKIVVATKPEDDEEKIKFLITTNAYPSHHYGDTLKVSCVLELPQNKDTTFDYRMYLAKDGIFYLCNSPRIEVLSNESDNKSYAFLLRIKQRIEEKVLYLLPAPESGLLLGLLLGGDDQLSQRVRENFSKTGLTHIVAVSGYNVTIVAEYLMLLGIALGLWRKQAAWFAMGGIFLFVVIVGFPASAVRAGVMGALLLWAMKNGRLGNAQNAIVFAAGAMLLFNPLLLRWDTGFQLSFLATAGIVYFYPVIEKYAIKQHGLAFFSEILFLTLSAQIFVLPIILNDFQKLPVISPLANLLVLPVIPVTMLLGFLMIVFAFLIPPLATVFSWLTFLPLRYETITVDWLAGWKFSSLEVVNFSWVWVAIWYIILIGLLFFVKRKRCSVQKVPF
jgi:competence protein ComEC